LQASRARRRHAMAAAARHYAAYTLFASHFAAATARASLLLAWRLKRTKRSIEAIFICVYFKRHKTTSGTIHRHIQFYLFFCLEFLLCQATLMSFLQFSISKTRL
jgi:hypothetical protein